VSNIRSTLEVVRRLVNQYLQNLDRRGDDWLALTSVVDHDGSVNESAREKIVMTVYNISRENVISTFPPAQPGNGQFAVVQPPLYINIYLMFMANFTGPTYPDGLEAISRVISFFQQTPWLTRANAPDLDPELDKITMELECPGAVEVNYVMGMMGTRYLPSVFYKLRMLPFVSATLQSRTYPVRGGRTNEQPDPVTPP
jgi:hypothetical protein